MATVTKTAKRQRRPRAIHTLQRIVEGARHRQRSVLEQRIREIRRQVNAAGKRRAWRAEVLIREMRDEV